MGLQSEGRCVKLACYKSGVVAEGFAQEKVLTIEIFVHVVKDNSIRLLLSIIMHNNMKLD